MWPMQQAPLVGRFGILMMKDLEEPFGDAITSIRSKVKRGAKASTLMIVFYIKPLWIPLTPWLLTRITHGEAEREF